MSDVSIERLRELRRTALILLENVGADLGPFVKKDGTFRRKPDSSSASGDVNVTTTCSCVMALTLTRTFLKFYENKHIDVTGDDVFKSLIAAPWMSSGLPTNNPFTTTLVIRAYGFLKEHHLLKTSAADIKKSWELHLRIGDVESLATKLLGRWDDATEWLALSMSEQATAEIAKIPTSGKASPAVVSGVRRKIESDLQRIVQSGWIYDASRFDKASAQTKKRLASKPTGYALTEANQFLLADQFPEISGPTPRSLAAICEYMAEDADHFRINEYPPTAAVVYWFVDGVDRGEIPLSATNWKTLSEWAATEFNHERSLVAAEHDAMMDPVAMAMSACLCARLRRIIDQGRLGATRGQLSGLPSEIELERSIIESITKQTSSGIWNKYFPLFHYQDAGSNFCFTFELLEAVLHEFGEHESRLFESATFVSGLEKAVGWCKNRLKCSEGTAQYTGWNSGGYLETLEKGQPESWATAVVHMFLWELVATASQHIQRLVLEKYSAKRIISPTFDDLLGVEVSIAGETKLLGDVFRSRIIDHFRNKTEIGLRVEPSKDPVSALLFGPPGTSKTDSAKAIAAELKWPLLELTPDHFVRGSLASIYSQADEIFTDLADLSGVVVFFDEMDALVQTREGDERLDITSQFLTTTMLPKLTRLHDQGRVVFLMATNFQERFDAAIKRPGRFDLLLCVGPPTLRDKLDRMHVVFKMSKSTKITREAGKALESAIAAFPELKEQFGLYTFGEYKSFLKRLGTADNLASKMKALGPSKLRKQLRDDARNVTLRLKDLQPLRSASYKWKRFDELAKKSFTFQSLVRDEVEITPIIRYLCDRKESRDQQ